MLSFVLDDCATDVIIHLLWVEAERKITGAHDWASHRPCI